MKYRNKKELADPIIVMNVASGSLPVNRDRYAPVGYLRKVNVGRSQAIGAMYTANRKAGKIHNRSVKPYSWKSEGGGVYTISDGNGHIVTMSNFGVGAYWQVTAPAWGIGQTRFRTGEEARRFAESLVGVSS